MAPDRHESKTRLLDATLDVVRRKGYAATRIEDICTEAGVTKGSFFHHFKSKEDLALAAAAHWNDMTTRLFAEAPYHREADPLDRLLAYVKFRREMLTGELSEFTCFAGTVIQEVYETHPGILSACGRNVLGHVKLLEADIAEAIRKYGVKGEWSAESLALYTQAVLQGAFVLAKASGGPKAAIDSVDHLYRYLELLFAGRRGRRGTTPLPSASQRGSRRGVRGAN